MGSYSLDKAELCKSGRHVLAEVGVYVRGRGDAECRGCRRERKRLYNKRTYVPRPPTIPLPQPGVDVTGKGEWRRVVKADPCSYCGQVGGTIDHIDVRVADRNDPTNWTGACLRCNAAKKELPLLTALEWTVVAMRYHDLRRELFAV